MDGLPQGVDPLLDATATYEPAISTGVYSYATHGAVVAVGPETGFVDLFDYAVAEDCGMMVNPMLVEGQTRGGVVQGIGTALFEEIPYDEAGQPLGGTLADYLLPGAAEMPTIKIGHLHTPTPHTEYGMKGMGEGGAIARPAAIANALREALCALGTPTGAEINETPITPRRVIAAISKAREPKARGRSDDKQRSGIGVLAVNRSDRFKQCRDRRQDRNSAASAGSP
jgi:carbon-monoxide dehydrogenase large subunit